MILFHYIVEVVITVVENFTTKGLTNGAWIGAMTISRHPFWSMTNCLESLLEKSLRGIHIALLAQHGINQVAISINGTIEVAPLPMNFDGGLIHIPGSRLSVPVV